jgi:iron complex transport system ATP-binding protein
MVEVSSLTVRYGRAVVVDSVSASVRQGEWVGLIGANGAGKTTLLRAVGGTVEHEGDVKVGGRAARSMSRRERARLVASVSQSPELPADMSVFDYTLLGRTPHISYLSVESRADRAHCVGVLERLDLSELAGRPLSSLSGGERQRAVLARALAQEAPVLLLDEATSALDLGHRVEALEIVDELRHSWGLTVVSALHDLTLAGQFADRLLLMSRGAVVAFGTPEEVLDEPVLESAFGCSVRIVRTGDGELVIAPRRRRDGRDSASLALLADDRGRERGR